mgnify:CR=1 FL=1
MPKLHAEIQLFDGIDDLRQIHKHIESEDHRRHTHGAEAHQQKRDLHKRAANDLDDIDGIDKGKPLMRVDIRRKGAHGERDPEVQCQKDHHDFRFFELFGGQALVKNQFQIERKIQPTQKGNDADDEIYQKEKPV